MAQFKTLRKVYKDRIKKSSRRTNILVLKENKMRFRPLGDRIVIERKIETKTAGGILIPGTTTDQPLEGIVVAVSKDVTDINIGDIVLYGRYSGNDIVIDNDDYLLLLLGDVSGILEDKE